MAVSVQDLLNFLKTQAETEIRGRPFKVFANQNVNKLSDVYVPIDPRYNAVVIEVRVTGTNPSATITVEGSSQIGSSDTVVLPDANATQLAVTSNKAFECTVGFPYVRVRIAAISGTFADGTGYTVYATPYRAGGVAAVTITATANENITQVLSAAVAVTNPLFVELTDGTAALGTGANPVKVGPARGTLTDRSGTITAGGTAQTLAALNATRNYLFVENPSNQTESLWVNFTTAAVTSQPSIELPPGSAFEMETGFVSTQLVSVIATSTGHPFIAKEG